MKVVDNFDYIKGIIEERDQVEDKFYFVQVLVRKGTNMNFNSSNRTRTIKYYCIPSTADLNKYKKEIKYICDSTGARAYINLNARSYRKAALKTIELLSKCIEQGHDDSAHTCYARALMDTPIVDEKTWIIDIDQKDYSNRDEMLAEMTNISGLLPNQDWHLMSSKNGYHMLIKPFRRDTFLKEIEEQGLKCELKIDASTNLYIPEDDTLPNSDQISLEFP